MSAWLFPVMDRRMVWMKCKEILQRIEEVYPADYAMEWDNVGLLAGRYEKEVKRIYVALDATEEVIEAAIRKGRIFWSHITL